MKFLIAIEPGTDTTAYGVVVPDLPGCFSAGDTLEEAFDNAREAIDAHCEILAEDSQHLPAPAAMAVHQANPDFVGWVWAMVDVPVESYWGQQKKSTLRFPDARCDALTNTRVPTDKPAAGFWQRQRGRQCADSARRTISSFYKV